ncbi:MAG: ABC transporter permease [Anaerobacillus sp.]|uniref:ABC transporter permease n=1 Tax=Anaerobacillus sp. TaxID=1872506 RepID=UPI00391B9946
MRKYLEFMKVMMKVETAYAAWYWAGTFATVVQLLILYYFWNAVYENRTTIADMPLEMMLTYMVIAMLMSEYVSGVGNQLAEDIREGNIAIELMRPYHLLNKLVAMDIGFKLSSSLRSALPMFMIAIFFIGIYIPTSIEGWLLFSISAVLGVLLGAQIDLIIGVVAFWTINIWGLRVFKEAIIRFFSGALIPISLFPMWFQTLSQYLPFQSMVFVPVSIYTGALSGSAAYMAIAIQFGWLVAIFTFVRVIWALAVRKVTIFGG